MQETPPPSSLLPLLFRPVIWIPGVFAGFVVFVSILLCYYSTLFIASRVAILLAVLLPFFVAGTLASLGNNPPTIRGFFVSAKRYYFPILLPAFLVLVISFVLILGALSPFVITGSVTLTSGIIAGIGCIIVCFLVIGTLFYDMIAVYRDTRIFTSIRESFFLVAKRPLSVLGILVVILLAGFLIGIICLLIYSLALADLFMPYSGMSSQEISAQFSGMSAGEWISFFGLYGFLVTAGIGAVGTCLFVTFWYGYRYRCYQILSRYEREVPGFPDNGPIPGKTEQGEYDEKGRWYKY
ncbi:MAG: hypothetical protein JXA44_09510 [Methanospirillaceae archaeon]|nr:hypothetical protein [Methanospirillaceae archaeon]